MIIEIRAPMWNGGKRVVGIAEYKLGTKSTDIRITYKNKAGEPIYPNVFMIDTPAAKNCPTMRLPSGVVLRLIPIESLTVKEG